MEALGLRVRKDILLPNADLGLKTLWRKLGDAGLPRDLVVSRLLPAKLRAAVDDATSPNSENGLAVRVAAAVGHIFGLTSGVFFNDQPLQLAGAATSLARFKVSASANATKLGAYAVYAHYLAITALLAFPEKPKRAMPETAVAFRKAVCENYGSLTYVNVLRFAWDCGVIVLPLNDSVRSMGLVGA